MKFKGCLPPLLKISFPAEFHGQTAVETAIQLHDQVKERLDAIDKITLTIHESAIRIIDKTDPLHNPADRDHCLQYMVAVGLLYGNLTADHYEDNRVSISYVKRWSSWKTNNIVRIILIRINVQSLTRCKKPPSCTNECQRWGDCTRSPSRR